MNIEDVEKLALLARIDIAENEKAEILKDLQSIIGYIDQIGKALAEEIPGNALVLRNVFREDENAHESGMYTEKILAEAPSTQDGFIKVQSIL